MTAIGGCIGFFTGDPLRLLEDVQMLRPHFFPGVPRILNRIYQAVQVAGNVPGVKGALFKRAVSTKLATVRETGQATHAFWDRLVFRKVSVNGDRAGECMADSCRRFKRCWVGGC